MHSPKVISTEATTTTAMSPKKRPDHLIVMNFYDALKAILDGESVTRLDWADSEWHCCMHNGRLHIHRPDTGQLHPWTITDGDMVGEDWVIV